jgi:hypothetical protein
MQKWDQGVRLSLVLERDLRSRQYDVTACNYSFAASNVPLI